MADKYNVIKASDMGAGGGGGSPIKTIALNSSMIEQAELTINELKVLRIKTGDGITYDKDESSDTLTLGLGSGFKTINTSHGDTLVAIAEDEYTLEGGTGIRVTGYPTGSDTLPGKKSIRIEAISGTTEETKSTTDVPAGLILLSPTTLTSADEGTKVFGSAKFSTETSFANVFGSEGMWQLKKPTNPDLNGWVALKMDSISTIHRYAFTASMDGANGRPSSWVMEVSMDSSNGSDGIWEMIDQVTEDVTIGAGRSVNVEIKNMKACLWVRFRITGIDDPGSMDDVAIQMLSIWGKEEAKQVQLISPTNAQLSDGGVSIFASAQESESNSYINPFSSQGSGQWLIGENISSGWVALKLSQVVKLHRYEIASAATPYGSPTAWVVEVSSDTNDGTDGTWKLLDSVSDADIQGKSLTRYIPNTSLESGTWLRLRITSGNLIAGYVTVSNLSYYGIDEGAPFTDSPASVEQEIAKLKLDILQLKSKH